MSLFKTYCEWVLTRVSLIERIGEDELLGRGIFSSDDCKRAKRGRVPFSVFLEKKYENKISVDRLDHNSRPSAKELGEIRATQRGRFFYGWAAILVDKL